MAKDGAARLRLRPVGAADRKKLPEYGPLGTGCPAIERAVAALYKGQNEESFWALMNAINYALELDTRVLVPLEAASDQPDGAAPWAEHPSDSKCTGRKHAEDLYLGSYRYGSQKADRCFGTGIPERRSRKRSNSTG